MSFDRAGPGGEPGGQPQVVRLGRLTKGIAITGPNRPPKFGNGDAILALGFSAETGSSGYSGGAR